MTVARPPLTGSDSPDDRQLLLYYSYLDLRAAQSDVRDWMEENCASLGLLGRVRVAQDGIGATLGGSSANISEHIAAVQAHPLLGVQTIDFKLAPWPRDCSAAAVAQTGFNTLTVAACKEVVALGSAVCSVELLPDHAGAHVSPQHFDAMLANPAVPTVLLDARNVYESRIGSFEAVSLPHSARHRNPTRTVRAVKAMSNNALWFMMYVLGLQPACATAQKLYCCPSYHDVLQV